MPSPGYRSQAGSSNPAYSSLIALRPFVPSAQ